MAEVRRAFKCCVSALAVALGALLLALPSSSEAAFPGGNGKLAFGNTSFGSFDIYSVSSTGSALPATRLTSSPVLENEPAWSPDGSKIAFSVVESTFGNVYVMNADGSGVRNLTSKVDSFNTKPAWSPDGSRIAFFSNRDGDNEIYSVKADGTGPQTNLSRDAAAEDYWPAWSPNGRQIAFTRSAAGTTDVYVMNANGDAQVKLTGPGASDDGMEPAWSPDGGQIAFRSGRDGDAEIYVMDADGTDTHNLTRDARHDVSPAWSPDGSRIAFASDRNAGNEDIYVMDPDGDNPTRFTSDPARDGYPDWQPLAGGSATITVRNAERPSTAGGRFDLSVDSVVVRTSAGHGDTGNANVSPGVHSVSEAPDGRTSPTEYATSISCTKNGNPDVEGSGTSIEVAVKYGDAEVCTVTNTLGEPTLIGSEVTVSPDDVTTGASPLTIRFADVTGDGVTTLSSSSSGPAPPAGFEIDGAYYELETTASFTIAEVCFPYTGSPPSIVHWVDGSPRVEPTTRDTGSEVCAEVTSFSPFALAAFVGGDDVDAPRVTCGSADDAWHADDVSIDCTAEDTESGLADPTDAAFSLSTSVPSGSEHGSASTGSRQVCDDAGNCATAGPIDGNKIDRKAPTLSLPPDKTVDATSPASATVSYAASAADGADPSPGVHCAPTSGSAFTIGTSTVTCTASDHVGNTDHGSFTVTVRGAKAQLDRLLQEVIAASKLPPAAKTQLLAQLRSAVARFDPSKPEQRKAMCKTLTTFATAVRLLSGRGIPPVQATRWIADANRIRAVIGC